MIQTPDFTTVFHALWNHDPFPLQPMLAEWPARRDRLRQFPGARPS
jgi:hypothetical protein